MSNIKNVIFDLGGVLINLDFSKTTQAFRDMGFPHFEKMYSQFSVDQLFEKLEKGEISAEKFYTVMQAVGDENITREGIRDAWNSLLLDFREDSLVFLKELKKKYNLFLLSNTNAIHQEAFNGILKKQLGIDSLQEYFTKSYYSHEIGLRKPNADIFEFVLSDAGIKASETMLIDDTIDNVNAAKGLGLHAILLSPGELIENLKY